MTTPAKSLCAFLALLLVGHSGLYAAEMILNEYNAVAKGKYLNGGSYSDDPTKVDANFAMTPGIDGRIEGNGGNWIELVTIQDHLDIRGWQLRWAETGANDTDGSDIWFGDSTVEQGILTFSPTAAVWSNLRKGTIITISQLRDIDIDTDWDGADRNFTDGVDAADVDVTIDLHTDTSYVPIPSNPNNPNADWWIHISTKDEQDKYDSNGGYDRLISTETNVDGDEPGKFSVGDADWELTIYDPDRDPGPPDQRDVFGPVGEDIADWGGGGVSDEEAARIEADPAAGVTIDDYDDTTLTTFGQPNEWGGNVQDFYSLRIPEPTTIALIGVALPWIVRRRRRS